MPKLTSCCHIATKTKWIAGGLAAAIVAAAGLVALAVSLIDRPRVQAALQERLSRALGGEVSWEALEFNILPAPHGHLRRAEVNIPGVVHVRVEDADAVVRLWPLLQGEVEVASVDVKRLEVRVLAAGGKPGKEQPESAEFDLPAAYREAIAPVADRLSRLAPDTTVSIADADIDVPAAPLRLRGLQLRARSGRKGMELALSGSSDWWKRASIQARVEYADLSARARLEFDELKVVRQVPAARLRGELRANGKDRIEVDAEVGVGALFEAGKVKLEVASGHAPTLAADLRGINLPEALALLRKEVNGLDVLESFEGRLTAQARVVLAREWHVRADIEKSDAAVKIAPLPWKISPQGGRVEVSAHGLSVHGAHGTLGDSSFSHVATRIAFRKPGRLESASGHASLQLEQWFPWLGQQVSMGPVTALGGKVEADLRRLALRFDKPAEADFEVDVAPGTASVALKDLPGPVSVAGGTARVDRKAVRFDKLAVGFLDAKAVASGTATLKNGVVEVALADGATGEKLVRWALEKGGVPLHLEPRTPLRFAAQRIAWGPGEALDAAASVSFDNGPALGIQLGWKPGLVDLRRLSIKDAMSDAGFSATLAGELQASFTGKLDGRSLASMLRSPYPGSGTAQGDFRLKLDREQPLNSQMSGKLLVEALDLSALAARGLRIERADLSGLAGGGLRIDTARVSIEDQVLDLGGAIRHAGKEFAIDARLKSPGLVIDRLLPKQDPEKGKGKPAADPKATGSGPWPLAVTGRIELQADFLQYTHFKVAPFAGTLVLERERAQLDVKAARLCGASLPFQGQATPAGYAVAARLAVKDLPMAQSGRCLTGEAMDITGNADLDADLRTEGKAPQELLRNLKGTAQLEMRDGRVNKFALIGNILSLSDITSFTKMKEEGFPYRSMHAKGRFEDGKFLVDEGAFDSNAVRLAVNGKVDLMGDHTELNVAVGLLARVDRVAGAIPLIGDVFGSTLLAVPVGVSGDIRNPRVVPLGPRALTDHLLGIFERTLKLPGKLVKPETPPAPQDAAPR